MTVGGGNVVEGNGFVSLLGVTIVIFEISSRVGCAVAIYVRLNVVTKSSGRPMIVIKPAALSTSLVMDIVGSCVDSVTLTVAVESVDVRISKPVPWKLRNNCGMRSPLPTVGPFVEVIYAPAVSGEGITCHAPAHAAAWLSLHDGGL